MSLPTLREEHGCVLVGFCNQESGRIAKDDLEAVRLFAFFQPFANTLWENVYRSTTAGGPYLFIGTTTSMYSTYLDTTVINGTTFYYVVREAVLSGYELCQSNETRATPTAIR